MTQTRSLEFRDVSVRLGARSVLRGVSFDVKPGEIVGMVGHNGSGKTTLLRVATRVLRQDGGEVLLGGESIAGFSRAALARALATVPQDTQLPYPFTALEVVLMGRAPHQPLFGLDRPEDLAAARAAMAEVGIEEFEARSIQKLSGGERQLVMFARALAQEPEFLLLDEPTSFLDLRHRIDLLGAVRRRVDAGAGALVVSHDLGLAARVCDRLVLLSHGEVVAVGPPGEVLEASVLERAFGVAADIVTAPDGSPLVVPRLSS
ncbi:MAG: ABC transporter ATP-binding protein [Myxococcota bacterium]|jgi:iron complex transport system ATP-binding protein|nr:ABC transporter ATP-binding protein [Myxococcota bacterium]